MRSFLPTDLLNFDISHWHLFSCSKDWVGHSIQIVSFGDSLDTISNLYKEKIRKYMIR